MTDSEYFVKLVGVVKDPELKLIFEYIEGCSLDKFLQKVDMNEGIKIAKDLAEALMILHSCGFVHADIKPENILITANK